MTYPSSSFLPLITTPRLLSSSQTPSQISSPSFSPVGRNAVVAAYNVAWSWLYQECRGSTMCLLHVKRCYRKRLSCDKGNCQSPGPLAGTIHCLFLDAIPHDGEWMMISLPTILTIRRTKSVFAGPVFSLGVPTRREAMYLPSREQDTASAIQYKLPHPCEDFGGAREEPERIWHTRQLTMGPPSSVCLEWRIISLVFQFKLREQTSAEST
ncbi:hypothetical protein IW261DRAFT_584020 [Armillaria novae-zelandiae]|uniref:Uncharacterized protein n=1 Tax=Armillaria novae-zelandiae TaxID=153914 RepID=A0AA39NYX3_9AGAR|nr:hypothetical protein IW261DRAFT_584020 [Armillaria novae-zelandiae]